MSACRHCGLPVRGARAGAPPYCCSGCWVASAVQGAREPGRSARPSDGLLARVALSSFLAMGVMVFSLSLYGQDLFDPTVRPDERGGAAALSGLFRLGALALSTPVLFLLGLPLLEAVVRLRRWLSADALIVAACLSAWGASAWTTLVGDAAHQRVYFETATMVLVLVGLGKWLDVRARERARGRLELLVTEDVPRAARLVAGGREESVELAALAPGERVRVRPGEVLPVDGTVLVGSSFVDTSALTGEAEPRSVRPGERVCAGFRLVDGCLDVRVDAAAGERLVDRVEELLARALERRPRALRVADRFAAGFFPLVLVLAVATVAWRWGAAGAERALLDGLSVVLIACPCALGLAAPLAHWVGLGRAWRLGVLVRGGDVLERLAGARRVLLDKTGTLTRGDLRLVELRPEPPLDEREALRLAAALEAGSEHPIGRALRAAWDARGEGELGASVRGFRALPGVGVEGEVVVGARARAARVVRDGTADAAEGRTRVVLELDGRRAATLALEDDPRPEAAEVVAALRRAGLEVGVLTGDGPGPARRLSERLGLDVAHSLSPADKLARIESAGAARTAYVGDGLNDAAALAAAGVGIAMHAGSARSLEAADVGLLRPGLGPLPELVRVARRAVRTAWGNLAWATGYNALGISLAATGRLTPVFAASAMVLSSLFVVLNSVRPLPPRPATRPRPGAGVAGRAVPQVG